MHNLTKVTKLNSKATKQNIGSFVESLTAPPLLAVWCEQQEEKTALLAAVQLEQNKLAVLKSLAVLTSLAVLKRFGSVSLGMV
jgi:hypothetical protein